MRSNIRIFVCSVFLLLFSTILISAQETRSSMNGQVLGEGNKPVASAKVTAVHLPTGTVYNSSTNPNGNFRIPNMDVGGPYKVSVTAAGYDAYSANDIELSLGTSYDLSVVLDTKTTQIEGVVVTGTRGANKNKTGSETAITSAQLRALPNVSGSLSDFVRITPQVRTTDRQISVAGQNNRYNAIYVDGGVNNDVFGLSASGTDGGQTGGNPFALEELDQITVSLAPFDVKQSGFAGGAINAITKAGTNNLQGSAYVFFRNNKLAGKSAEYFENDRKNLPNFNAYKAGMSLGTPIVKNKLFLFTTYEIENSITPKPFSFSQFLDQANLTQNDLSLFRQKILEKYNYDIGTYDNAKDKLLSRKFVSRADWNINDRNKLTLKYKFTEFDYLNELASNNTTINFSNGSQSFLSKTHYGALEWNTKISDKISNNLVISGKSVVDDRDFTGSPFPAVALQTLGGRRINIGSETFSNANYLSQKVYSFNDNFEFDINKHHLLLGTQHDFYQSNNLFVRNNFGSYVFNNQTSGNTILASGFERFFQYYLMGNTGNIPGTTTPYNANYSTYSRTYAYSNPQGIGDDLLNDNASAKFDVYQMGYYIQDTWKPKSNLTFNLGIRVDVPFYEATNVNADFNNITAPLLEKAIPGLEVPRTGKFINPVIHYSPRFGFNYILNPESQYRSQVRGGTGVFTSRVPLVWAGGAYNLTGANLNEITESNIGLNQFIADPANQYTINGQKFGGEVNLFTKNFKLPQRWKSSLGLDQKLPLGFSLTTDLSYDKILNEVYYRNINLANPVGTIKNGGDNRPRWNRASLIDPRYTSIYLGSNTDQGYSYTISNTLSKKFSWGLFASLSYTYNDSYGIFDGTSSQNSSQWRNIETVNGKNSNLPLSRSQFAIGSRITGLLSYDFRWAKNLKTSVALFYEGINGNTYSYIYGSNGGNFMLNDDLSDNALIYVPKDRNDITLSEGYLGLTADYQWNMLNQFIENDPYLKTRRGQYAERNSNRTPWSNVVDLRLMQEIKLDMGGKSQNFQISFDIFNLTNLLNKKWGLRYLNQNTSPGFFSHRLMDVVGMNNNGDGTYTPIMGVNPDNLSTRAIDQYNNSGISSSIWQMQLGIRYYFK